jgi:hypothetical protein
MNQLILGNIPRDLCQYRALLADREFRKKQPPNLGGCYLICQFAPEYRVRSFDLSFWIEIE